MKMIQFTDLKEGSSFKLKNGEHVEIQKIIPKRLGNTNEYIIKSNWYLYGDMVEQCEDLSTPFLRYLNTHRK